MMHPTKLEWPSLSDVFCPFRWMLLVVQKCLWAGWMMIIVSKTSARSCWISTWRVFLRAKTVLLRLLMVLMLDLCSFYCEFSTSKGMQKIFDTNSSSRKILHRVDFTMAVAREFCTPPLLSFCKCWKSLEWINKIAGYIKMLKWPLVEKNLGVQDVAFYWSWNSFATLAFSWILEFLEAAPRSDNFLPAGSKRRRNLQVQYQAFMRWSFFF